MTAEQLDEIRRMRERIAELGRMAEGRQMNELFRGKRAEPDRKELIITAAKRVGFSDPGAVWDELWQQPGEVDELIENLAAEKSNLLTGSAVMERRIRRLPVSDGDAGER